jgi:hypothetical protein
VHHRVELGHVVIEPVEVDLLLEVGSQYRRRLHARDGEHGLMVELGVVEPVEQMDPTWPGGCDAHADASGALGVTRRHERRRLLVMYEHESHPVLVAA